MTEPTQHRSGGKLGDDPSSGSQNDPPGTERAGNDAVRGRRRFLGGVATTGFVAFTVAGRPAWANGCSLSAQMSGNASAQLDSEPCGGEGLSYGYWRNHTYQWHSAFPPTMLFASAFGSNAFPGMTLYDVIMLPYRNGRDDDGSGSFLDTSTALGKEQSRYEQALRTLGMQSVAALQNAATPINYDLTVAEVQASFRRAYDSGDSQQMEITKDSLDRLNNQGGSLA